MVSGPGGCAKIQYLIRIHPELHMEFKGARIRILNPDDPHHFVTITKPGIIRKLSMLEIAKQKLNMAAGQDTFRQTGLLFGAGAGAFCQI